MALNGQGILITGPSGAGKSALALQLMAFGADLVADDRVRVRVEGGSLVASPLDPISGMIEARGIGLLSAQSVPSARVVALVDLSKTEAERLPEIRKIDLLGQSVTLLAKVDAPHFAAAILQFLKSGRQDPECSPKPRA